MMMRKKKKEKKKNFFNIIYFKLEKYTFSYKYSIKDEKREEDFLPGCSSMLLRAILRWRQRPEKKKKAGRGGSASLLLLLSPLCLSPLSIYIMYIIISRIFYIICPYILFYLVLENILVSYHYEYK